MSVTGLALFLLKSIGEEVVSVEHASIPPAVNQLASGTLATKKLCKLLMTMGKEIILLPVEMNEAWSQKKLREFLHQKRKL